MCHAKLNYRAYQTEIWAVPHWSMGLTKLEYGLYQTGVWAVPNGSTGHTNWNISCTKLWYQPYQTGVPAVPNWNTGRTKWKYRPYQSDLGAMSNRINFETENCPHSPILDNIDTWVGQWKQWISWITQTWPKYVVNYLFKETMEI